MINITLIVSISLCSTSAIAATQFYTGNQWYSVCSDQDNTFMDDYVAGVAEGFDLAHPGDFCIPYGVTPRQLSDIFCSYLKASASKRQMIAGDLAAASFIQAFPCSK